MYASSAIAESIETFTDRSPPFLSSCFRNVNPPQVFDFNLDALDKVLGPMLYQNHPAEGGNHEEG
jgi:hypothetical protein